MPRIEPIPYDEVDPELRARYGAGASEGRYSTTVPLRIFAYAKAHAIADDEAYRLTFRRGLLGPRMEELVRIRSAQLNGCAPCSSSRKDLSISEADTACMLVRTDDERFSPRERLALRFLEKFNRDHHAIGDEDLRELAAQFTIAEICELGQLCARFIGGHRWTHILDIFGDDEPVLRYDPAQVNVGSQTMAGS